MNYSPKIKLCGMMRPQDVITAAELGADYVGFILSEGFKRTVSYETFCELSGFIHGTGTKKVGVFVNEPVDNIAKRYAESLDLIQLHGSEDDGYINTLRQYTDKPVIKAFKVTSAEDIKRANESTAELVLLDSGTGTGKLFDHSLIKGIDRPYFLAGGLTPENVSEAVRALSPYAVDASSSLETEGRKDMIKMKAFVKAVRGL